MSGNTTPREYLVTVRFRKEGQMPSNTDLIEHLPMVAYCPEEAVYQVFYWLNSRIGTLDGLIVECVSVGPNTSTMLQRTTALLNDIRLRLMPAEGRAS